jgi:predicted Rossmann-fold nucleotide-binding protein
VSRRRGRTIEIDTLAEFDALVSRGARRMRGWRVQGVDLRGRGDQLRELRPEGSLFLGVALEEADGQWLREQGALVFPEIPHLPFDPYRSELYTPDELYRGLEESGYESTPDSHIYGWARARHRGSTAALASALHDRAIDAALDRRLAAGRNVGVMGGHDAERGSPGFHTAATLGRALARAELHVVTGGGPGAMEAANLGVYLREQDDDALAWSDQALSAVPRFRPSVTEWARAAFAVRAQFGGEGANSIGIPTWFYGHEPPNAFASGIAKYFQNALREDTLLRRCDSGIVFLPGSAGTVQEIFQDGCENYYADEATVAPMILLGRAHWTEEIPAWPLLRALSRGRPMESLVSLVDSVEEAVELIAAA